MYRYIIVDDEAIIRRGLIKKIQKLKALPMECAGQAANGVEGIRLIQATDPDIIITDMKMPEMDGVDFLDSIGRFYPDKKVIVLSSYDDFEYMNTAIENRAVGYVLKPFSAEEIKKQLIKAIERIEQQKLLNNSKLLSFIYPNTEIGMPGQLQQEDYLDVKKFLLIGIATTNPSFLKQLELLCAQPFGGRVTVVPFEDVLLKYSYFIVLMDYEGCMIESYAASIAEKLVGLDTDHMLYVSISSTCDNVSKLHHLYKEYNANFMDVRLSCSKYVLRPNSRQPTRVHSDEEIDDIFSTMRYHPDIIIEQLNTFFDELAEHDAPFGVIMSECRYMVELVNKYASQHGIESNDIMDGFFQKYIFENDIKRIKQEFSDYITHIFNSIINSSQGRKCLLGKVKQYINENYGSKITLDSIASEFFINPTYFSYIFKLETQENFNDYLTKIRMEKARQLLTETNISIDKISKEVGYKNAKYFFKVFKKHTSLTPMEYRNRKQG